jgi:hypothetical protein
LAKALANQVGDRRVHQMLMKKLAVAVTSVLACGIVLVAAPSAGAQSSPNGVKGAVSAQAVVVGPWDTEADCQRARAQWPAQTSNCFERLFLGWFFVGF